MREKLSNIGIGLMLLGSIEVIIATMCAVFVRTEGIVLNVICGGTMLVVGLIIKGIGE